MFEIKIAWKPFKIHLAKAVTHLRSVAGSEYCGISANGESLTVHFKSTPDRASVSRIQEYFDSLTDVSESEKFKQELNQNKAVALAKANVLLADISSLIPAERKLLMGAPLDSEDKASILAKYPQ